ncbi:MAG: Antidote-toxin recognition MazE, bacterial antitoxin [Patescibacteria group bacterium]|nr:Antidote-toxin recognition MazE, bacterial antitoxin [Patescibacteria group bacterium]
MDEQVTVSSNYQVVIPKKIRRELGIRVGQKISVKQRDKKIVFDVESVIDKYANSIEPSCWEEDPAIAIRKWRDEDRG